MSRNWMFGGAMLSAVVLVAGGCASSNQDDGGRHGEVAGMMCPTCETVWVGPHPGSGGNPKVQAMHWGREHVCPDCDAMAQSYFKDGEKVLHDCPTCKVTPRPATPVEPTHPRGTHT